MLWCLILLPLIPLRWYIYRKDIHRLGQPKARHRLWQSVLFMFLFYFGILGLLLLLENRLVYHPLSVSDYWHPPSRLSPQNVTFETSKGDKIHAWWCSQANAPYTILFSHGNAANLSSHAWIIPAMREKFGCNVLIYDYPGFGHSTGVPGEQACYASAVSAYDWLTKSKQIPPQDIILMGQSLGSAMACELATKCEHKALVLLSPFTSIRDLGQELVPIFPVKWIMSHHYDNLGKLKDYHKPLLIGHSTADEVIPFHHGQQLFESSTSVEKHFYKIEGERHNALPAGFFKAMSDFVFALKE